jgi:zinc protease
MKTITKIILPNGLLVLLKEIHTAPLISQWIWYRVGSRDETPGITGISHWVEHMQFKGTDQFPTGVLDKVISREGGFWNALTHLDWTTYFETMPADKIDVALLLEADRMVNSRFDPDEVELERTVIISERQGNENEPLFRLGEEIQSTAFQVHSYRHEVIGNLVDLQTIGRDDLFIHYRNFYTPNNSVLALAGDFDTESMLERLCSIYEAIPKGKEPFRETRYDNPQIEEKRINVEGPGETTYVQVAYHVPGATHFDFVPLLVADSLLSGPGNLNMFSEGLSNKTSRLYRALVEQERAIGVFGGLQATIDPFLYTITTVVHPNSNQEEIITSLDGEIQSLQDTPPSSDELVTAMKQARALFAYGSERITNQAFWLGFSEMIDSIDWFTDYLERLETVTTEDVHRVAQVYLRPENRVIGAYLPTESKSTTSF